MVIELARGHFITRHRDPVFFSSLILPRLKFAIAAAFFKIPNACVISRGITSRRSQNSAGCAAFAPPSIYLPGLSFLPSSPVRYGIPYSSLQSDINLFDDSFEDVRTMLEFFKLLLRREARFRRYPATQKMNGIEAHTSSMPYSPCSMEKPS